MSDNIKAAVEALVQAGSGWEGVGDECGDAWLKIVGKQSSGHNFGWFAERAHIPAAHDKFITAMTEALLSGVSQMYTMARAIQDTAKEFGATDVDVADTFHNLDGTPA